uniref:Immunoglobulin V-set domain-containing protein n=1 Tax=Astyanax mexicanus TaxID=7994 RepID=A0A3B1K6I4_ASTMX
MVLLCSCKLVAKVLLWCLWWLLWSDNDLTVIGCLRGKVTISCSYPEEFQTNTKTFYKQNGPYLSRVISTTDSQKGRFSISDNRRSRVTVRISDVKENDGGVYYCGEWIGGNEVSYYLLYTEIHLQVSGEKQTFTTDYELIMSTMYVLAQRPSPSPAQGTYSMVQLPQPSPEAQGYSTVSFQNNPDSAPDASFALGKC